MREGWQSSSLESVVKFIDYRGRTPKKTEGGLRLITAKNVKMGYLQIEPREFVAPEIYDDWMTRGIPKKGDVLFTTEAPLANVAQLDTDEKVVFAQRIIVLQSDREKLHPTFLKYALLSKGMQNRIHEQGTGATVKGIKSKLLKKVQVTFPPSVSEQKRIVAILNEVFAGIDDAIANTEKNLTNARELFESYLNAIFKAKNDNWRQGKFANIAGSVSTGPFGSLLHKADYVFDGVPLVNPAHIQCEGIIPDLRKTVSQDTLSRLEAYVLKENDIVIGRRGEIGRCAVITQTESGWLCGTGCFFIRPLEGVNSVFLSHLLRSDVYTSKLESLSTGATMQNLNNKALSDLLVALPPIEEQRKIISTLESLSIEVQSLEAIYQQKLTALNELKQSILQKAFTGELTADTASQAEKAEEIAA